MRGRTSHRGLHGRGGDACGPGNDWIVAVEHIGKGGADLVPAEHIRLERGQQAVWMTRRAIPDDVPNYLQPIVGKGRRRHVGARQCRSGTVNCKCCHMLL